MIWMANLAYLLAGVCYLPVLVYQMVVQKKNRRGWRQRFGHLTLPPPARRRVWVHAVSLGEVNCTPALVRQLTTAVPDCEVVVSTTTDTGYARACKLYPPERVFRYPLDLSWVVRRALDCIQPSLIVLVELEVWPILVRLAHRCGIPVVVINGRLTERSAHRLAWLGRVSRVMFSQLTWVGAQDRTIAERFIRLGVPAERVTVTGSLKWDTAEVTDAVPGAEALAAALGIPRDRPLWVCGSTGPGEEALVLDAYQRILATVGAAGTTGPDGDEDLPRTRVFHPQRARATAPQGATVLRAVVLGRPPLMLALIPRKPERFDEVAALIRSRGFDCVRRSEHPDGSAPVPTSAAPSRVLSEGGRVFLGDTMGELRKFYTLARVVFVGRSLVPMGGSDPMEVAALGKPVLVGPHMDNFQVPVDCLRAGNALGLVHSAAELAQAVARIAGNAAFAAALGQAARRVVLQNQGVTARTVRTLTELLSSSKQPA